MVRIADVAAIRRKTGGKGYEIAFSDGRTIWLTKRRTIPALLLLIKHGTASEADLARGSQRLAELKRELKGKCDESWIQDFYADANKPFSELWNEEGFTWIHPAQERLHDNQKYVLRPEDHDRLFEPVMKAFRRSLNRSQKNDILGRQEGYCNLCGSRLMPKSRILKTTFAKDRVRVVYDHRIPVEKGGSSDIGNYQALCFYCNKCKWQICNICNLAECPSDCVLAYPERNTVIAPTGEDIRDRLNRRSSG